LIFVDRSIPKSVATALKAVRSDVSWLEDHFPPNTRDTEWLSEVANRGWIAVLRDKHVNTRPGERLTIEESGAACFILNQGRDPTRWEYLKLLAATIDEMERLDAITARPYIFTISREGLFRSIL
jgi:hypothetical protein